MRIKSDTFTLILSSSRFLLLRLRYIAFRFLRLIRIVGCFVAERLYQCALSTAVD